MKRCVRCKSTRVQEEVIAWRGVNSDKDDDKLENALTRLRFHCITCNRGTQIEEGEE